VHAKQGKFSESTALLEVLSKNAPDWILDRYMHWLVLSAIKVTERFDLAEKMYEAAWAVFKSRPNFSQDDLIWIGQSLFGAYIRSNNSSKQRLARDRSFIVFNFPKLTQTPLQHAMSMWKDLKTEQYYFWSIVAMVTPLADSDKMLAIAERMIETWFEQGKIQNQEQIEYYSGVLVKQNKLQEALNILRSEPARKAFSIPSQLSDHEARLLVSLGRVSEARDIYRSMLQTVNSDEWSWYLGFFDNLFAAGLAEGNAINSHTEVASMLSNLQAQTLEDKTKYRGPFLAALEFANRLSAAGVQQATSTSLFTQYFEHFGGKSCFFRDIAPYLAALGTADRRAVLVEIERKLGVFNSHDDQSSKIDWSYRLVSVESVRRSLSASTSLHETVVCLLKQYQETRHWNAKKEATERMCGDDLALLAAHYALDNRTSASSLFDAAAILEYAISTSKHNFQLRLLLLHIYSALGAARGSLRQVEELDIKQIQLDSMGYLIMDTLSNQMQFQELLSLAKRTRHFHDDNRKNTNDFILEAYKNNRYSKVKEIGQFHDRLESSLQLVVARVAQVFSQLVLENSTFESVKDLLNTFFSSASFDKVPMTESEVTLLRDNADGDVEDCFGALPIPNRPKFLPNDYYQIWRSFQAKSRDGTTICPPSTLVKPLPIAMLIKGIVCCLKSRP
jgi:N-terminal acetyltransferase B complex non-catalytic subunit